MTQEFIPYQQALELKELGFDEPCLGFYEFGSMDEEWHLRTKYVSKNEYNDVIHILKAPLYQQAFRWFRENHDLFGVVEGKGYDHKRYYIYSINGKWHPSQPGSDKPVLFYQNFDKPEEAELACLNKLIETVKNGTK
jgi:hypothetical protein